jgi:hypothetical protein
MPGVRRCCTAVPCRGVCGVEHALWDQVGRPVNQKYPVLYTAWSAMEG